MLSLSAVSADAYSPNSAYRGLYPANAYRSRYVPRPLILWRIG